MTFTKSSDNNAGEAAGLRWLGEAMECGGARVARVIAVDSDLEIERIDPVPASPHHARAFGRALAHTHAAGAPWWGSAPTGWQGPAHVGRSRTKLFLSKDDAPQTFGEFYGEHRIADFTKRTVERGVMSTRQARGLDAVAERLIAGDFDFPQPALVREAGSNSTSSG